MTKDMISRVRSPIVKMVVEEMVKDAGSSEEVAKAAAKGFGSMLKAASIAAKVQRLYQFYEYARIEVTVDKPLEHKPHPQADGAGDKGQVTMTAHVGISDEDWNHWQSEQQANPNAFDRSVRDCLRSYGFPVDYDLQDLAWDLAGTRVSWEIVEGDGSLIRVDSSAGIVAPYEIPAVSTGPHTADSPFVVNVMDEASHDPALLQVRRPVTAEATLSSPAKWDSATIITTIIAGATTGGIGAIVAGGPNTLEGIITDNFTKKARGHLVVEYCQPTRRLRVSVTRDSTANIDQILFLNASGTTVQHDVMTGVLIEQADGSFAGDLNLDSTATYSGHLGDEQINGSDSGTQLVHAIAVPIETDSIDTTAPGTPYPSQPSPPPRQLTVTFSPAAPAQITQHTGSGSAMLDDTDGVQSLMGCRALLTGTQTVNAPTEDPGGPITDTAGDDIANGWFLTLDLVASGQISIETEWLAHADQAGDPAPH
jgi:hypothetical protein